MFEKSKSKTEADMPKEPKVVSTPETPEQPEPKLPDTPNDEQLDDDPKPPVKEEKSWIGGHPRVGIGLK